MRNIAESMEHSIEERIFGSKIYIPVVKIPKITYRKRIRCLSLFYRSRIILVPQNLGIFHRSYWVILLQREKFSHIDGTVGQLVSETEFSNEQSIRVICIRKRGFEGSEFATRAAHPGVNVYTGEIDYQFRLWSGRDSTGTRLIPPFYRSFSPRFTSKDYVFSYDSVFA